MPAVLVHGVPESAAIWRPLIDALDRDDIVTLSPPGFGAPVPDGFGATREDYLAWLVAEVEAIDGPIDLVGHDWGGGHVVGLAMTRPDLVRTWASDVLGLFHPEYEWHDMARDWQTPDVGEAAVEMMMGLDHASKQTIMTGLGMPDDIAADVAAANDETMGRCILSLYRSATRDRMDEAAADLPTAAGAPGLAIIATEDHYVGDTRFAMEVAERAGARTRSLVGASHWWMLDQPEAAATMLQEFWADHA